MKSRTYIIIALITLFSLGGAGIAFAGWSGFHSGRKMNHMKKFIEWRIDDALDEVKASDAQKERVQSLADALFEKVSAEFGDREASRQAFINAFRTESPDKEAVRTLIDARIEAARRVAYAAADAAFQVHETLEAEQRVELLKIIESHHTR